MIKAKLHTLPGGLRVVLARMPDSPTATVEVLVQTGSKYESAKELGLSHFLEHMCFKGTERRPSALAVSEELDKLGAVSNAFTSTEVTGYWAKAGEENLPGLLDVIADIYQNSIFKKEDLEKEKGVIVEEIRGGEDDPQRVVSQLFESTMHGNQPAGRPVIGNIKSVKAFTVKDFERYRRKHYVASATVIVVAGKFEEKRTLKTIKTLFASISHGKKLGKKRTTIVHRGPKVVTQSKDIDQAHLMLGVRAFHYKDERILPLAVLRSILASGMSSRLFQRIRVERGLCYYIGAGSFASTDHGEFVVYSGVDPKRLPEAIEAILEELKRLKTELVKKSELDKVKSLMISRMDMGLETSDSVSDYFGERVIFYDDLRTPAEREKKIKKITPLDIQKVAKEIFTDEDLLLAVVGRKINIKPLKKHLSLK